MRAELKAISALLSQRNATGSFAVQVTAPSEALDLWVNRTNIRGPASPEKARELCAQARLARYGYKDETRLDPSVRDTWEIPASQITVGQEQRWWEMLDRTLRRIEPGLGIPQGCHLRVQLHNLLIYAPGQFFAPHRDSEKSEGMIGTLVMLLPSRATGGELVIEHRGETKSFQGSELDIECIAFYADCPHEVKPVTDGYRLALTYNLVMEGEPACGPGADIERLVTQVQRFFSTPLPSRDAHAGPERPSGRLVYLLDHQYSAAGLDWHHLKGSDAQTVAALREAAQRLDCEILLALADLRCVWQCEDANEYTPAGQDWDEAEQDRQLSLGVFELVGDNVTLRQWVGAGALPSGPVNGTVSSDDLCYTTDFSDLTPFGGTADLYTGNEGSEITRWYHRAAVVLWPRANAFMERTAASPLWAIQQVTDALGRDGDDPKALTLIQRLLPLWRDAIIRHNNNSWDEGAWIAYDDTQQQATAVLDATLPLAAKLHDPAAASTLLTPFALTAFSPAAAVSFPAILDAYGEPWCRTLLEAWDPTEGPLSRRSVRLRLAWLADTLPALSDALCTQSNPRGKPLARDITARQWSCLLDRLDDSYDACDALPRGLLGLIRGATSAQDAEVLGGVLAYVQGSSRRTVLCGLAVLKAAVDVLGAGALSRLELGALHAHCVSDVQNRLHATRGPDDWAIGDTWAVLLQKCDCTFCAALEHYLRAADQIRWSPPLDAVDFEHGYEVLKEVTEQLPVSYDTGSKDHFALKKTTELFKQREAENLRWQQDLEWLNAVAPQI